MGNSQLFFFHPYKWSYKPVVGRGPCSKFGHFFLGCFMSQRLDFFLVKLD